MAKFKDSDGREWALSLNVGLVAKLRTDAGFELGKSMNAQIGETLFGDPEKIAKVLWVLVETQAENRGTSPESFIFALDGPTLESASTALIEAIIDFFHRGEPAKRMKARLPEILAKADRETVQEMESTLRESLGNGLA